MCVRRADPPPAGADVPQGTRPPRRSRCRVWPLPLTPVDRSSDLPSPPPGRPGLASRAVGWFSGDPGVMARYLATSGVNVVNHQALLQVAVRWWGWSGGQANVFAAVVAALPAYLLSRYWVWEAAGRPSLRTEIVPFWTISLLGLLASTLTASLADRLFDEPLMISVGSLVGYFVVWVLKFLILDQLFNRGTDADRPVSVA